MKRILYVDQNMPTKSFIAVVDMIIYGHSSHQIRGMEDYKGKLILYGTGDIINDYEGFENLGGEKYNHWRGIYIADIEPLSGNLVQFQIVPIFMNRFRLECYLKESQIWSAKRQSLVVYDANKGKDVSDFINTSHLIIMWNIPAHGLFYLSASRS